MSLKCGIFNSTAVETDANGLLRGNKAVDAAFLARMFSTFFSSGIAPGKDGTSFASAAVPDTMKVRTSPGACHIEGYFAYDDAAETRTFTPQQTARTAARVMRLDTADGSIRVLWRECIRQGELLISVDDNALLPVRDGSVYDLVTCVVDIPAGAEVLTDGMVTDLRGDDTLCGYASTLGS